MNLGLLAGHGVHPQVHVHPRPPGGYRHWLDVPDDHPSQPELKRFEARVRDKTRNLRPVGLLDRILAFFGLWDKLSGFEHAALAVLRDEGFNV